MPETQTATRIAEVGRVVITVTDQDRAIDFYTTTLGFEKRADIPYGGGYRWVEVAPPGGHASIALVLPMGDDTAGGKHTGVVLDSTDVEATHTELRSRGVDVDADLMRGPEIPTMFWFRDQDANVLLVVQQPA
jgi:predicted enzyme related to lactoylglutathione lyase